MSIGHHRLSPVYLCFFRMCKTRTCFGYCISHIINRYTSSYGSFHVFSPVILHLTLHDRRSRVEVIERTWIRPTLVLFPSARQRHITLFFKWTTCVTAARRTKANTHVRSVESGATAHRGSWRTTVLIPRECQKKDWKRHKEECKSLALKRDLQWRNQMALSQPHSVGNHLKCYLASITKNIELRDSYDGRKELGRCMVAKHDFNVRDCIYSESSYACIPIHSSNYYACMKCLQLVSTPEFICPLCKTSYCSSECMKADAGTHKRFCHLFSMLKRILNTATTSIPITATKSFVSLLTDESLWRLTLRILLHPEPTQADALGFEDMTNLCYTPLTDNCQESWVGPFLIAISQAIADLLSNATPLSLSADSIAALFTRLCHNVFSITSSRMLTNGYGLFLVSSFINHSCTPNAIASFVDDSIRIHAIGT